MWIKWSLGSFCQLAIWQVDAYCSEKKEENRTSLLFKSGCNHQIILPLVTGSWLSSLTFFVPQDMNLYVHISIQRSGVWVSSITKAMVWHIASPGVVSFPLEECVVFIPGQIPVWLTIISLECASGHCSLLSSGWNGHSAGDSVRYVKP